MMKGVGVMAIQFGQYFNNSKTNATSRVPLTSTPRNTTKGLKAFEQFMLEAKPTLDLNNKPITEKSNHSNNLEMTEFADWTNFFSSNTNSLNSAPFNADLLNQLKDELLPNQLSGQQYGNLEVPYNTKAIKSNTLLDNAKTIAQKITTIYEGGGVTGDFDGQGISIGYLQWNMGSGTLQPMLREMANGANTKDKFNTIFNEIVNHKLSNGKIVKIPMAEALREVLNRSKSEQLAWAKSINDSNNHITEPWKSAFKMLIKDPSFNKIEDQFAKPYLNTAIKIMNDENFGVKTVRGYALAFDIAVQNGSVKASAQKLIKEALSGENNKLTNPNHISLTRNQKAVIKDLQQKLQGVNDPETKKLYYTAAAVAISSNDRFVKDVWSRKAAIVSGSGKVHGSQLNLNADAGLSDHTIA